MVNLPSVSRLIPTRDESNEGGVVCKLQDFEGLMMQLLVYREKGRGEWMQPSGDPVLMVRESETCFTIFTCCLLSDRKSVSLMQVESGMCSWESLFYSSWDDQIDGRG